MEWITMMPVWKTILLLCIWTFIFLLVGFAYGCEHGKKKYQGTPIDEIEEGVIYRKQEVPADRFYLEKTRKKDSRFYIVSDIRPGEELPSLFMVSDYQGKILFLSPSSVEEDKEEEFFDLKAV